MRSLAGALPVGVVQFDLDRRIVYANEQLYEIVGAHPDADEDTLLTCVVDPNVVEDALARLYSGGDVDIEMYIDRLDRSGRRLCTLAMRALIDSDGAVFGGVACLADVTDAARMRAELEERATIDSLTGCLNRSSVIAALANTLTSSARGRHVAQVTVESRSCSSTSTSSSQSTTGSVMPSATHCSPRSVPGCAVWYGEMTSSGGWVGTSSCWCAGTSPTVLRRCRSGSG